MNALIQIFTAYNVKGIYIVKTPNGIVKLDELIAMVRNSSGHVIPLGMAMSQGVATNTMTATVYCEVAAESEAAKYFDIPAGKNGSTDKK